MYVQATQRCTLQILCCLLEACRLRREVWLACFDDASMPRVSVQACSAQHSRQQALAVAVCMSSSRIPDLSLAQDAAACRCHPLGRAVCTHAAAGPRVDCAQPGQPSDHAGARLWLCWLTQAEAVLRQSTPTRTHTRARTHAQGCPERVCQHCVTPAVPAQYVSLDRIWQIGDGVCPSTQWTSYCPLGARRFLILLVRVPTCFSTACWHFSSSSRDPGRGARAPTSLPA